jgi:hypothetical protein
VWKNVEQKALKYFFEFEKYFANFNRTLFPCGSPYRAVERIVCFTVSFKGNPKETLGPFINFKASTASSVLRASPTDS